MRSVSNAVRAARVSLLIAPSIAFQMAHAQNPNPTELIPNQQAIVALLRVHRAGQSDETGAAILVGVAGQRAYLATARHVISPKEDDGNRGLQPTITLQWITSPQQYPVSIFEHDDPALDLGLVSVGTTGMPANTIPLVVGEIKPDYPMHMIGHPHLGTWSIWAGNVANDNGPDGNVGHFVYTGGSPAENGYSGGAVFDSHGHFLGMHIASAAANNGVAVKAIDLMRFQSAWHVPSTIQTAEVTTPPQPPSRYAVLLVSRAKFVDDRAIHGLVPDESSITIEIPTAHFRYKLDLDTPWQDQSLSLPAGDYEYVFTADINPMGTAPLITGTCRGLITVRGAATFQPHIKLARPGYVESCSLEQVK